MNAFKQTSVMRCEVRTFPAQTAASGEGESRVSCGIMTSRSMLSAQKAVKGAMKTY